MINLVEGITSTEKLKLVELGKKALEYTNQFRKEKSRSELKWHQALFDIGFIHSKDMATGKYSIRLS